MILMNLFTEKEWRHRYREQTCGHSRGSKELDVGESSIIIYIYTTMWKIDSWQEVVI